VNPLARRVYESLSRGAPELETLALAGEAEPEKAASSLGRALAHPDLAPSAERWFPALLASARPGFAAAALHEIAERYRSTRGAALDVAATPALPCVLGSSGFLARLLLRHPHWCEDLAGDPPPAPDDAAVEPDWTAIRIAKYRGLLRVAGRDLIGRPFGESLRELSDLADRCLDAATRCAAHEAEVEAPAVLGLGKLGGRELNLSSDVDLLFVYDADEREDWPRNQAVTRFVRQFKTHLEVPSEDGFAYRVDLDLRPEGKPGALANSTEAALNYYATFGADWERQMLIRLRPIAGPLATGRGFAEAIEPFVYRRMIDPAAVHAVRDMKARIEDERRRAGRDLEVDLKEGPGGIRDVEFLVQALQLFYGGQHAELRTGNVPDALTRLGSLGLLPAQVADSLIAAYLWLRRAEHCAQLVEERQVHAFPRDARQQGELARRMGYADPEQAIARDRLLDEWTAVRAEVRSNFERLVLESADD
jgi:glutamate-ammonia-ligase adenylyltransferase